MLGLTRRPVPAIPAIAAASLAAALGARGVLVEPRMLRILRYEVPLPRLPDAFHGYRILHMSDLHLGALTSGTAQVARARTLAADLIAVTGDMIETERAIDECGELLGQMSATDGVVCVLGNHDHAATRHGGIHRLVDVLEQRGVRTLTNDAMPICRGAHRMWLVGVDDPFEFRADLDRAYRSVPEGEPSILLAHSPDICTSPRPGGADLVLTGHCHGGQIRTPFGAPFTRTRRRFRDVLGLQDVDGTPVHMSAGLGATIPVRLFCPPEVTILHLVAGARAQTEL